MPLRRLAVPPLAVFTALAMGCSYTSQYRAPADGRARVVWKEDRAIAVLPGGNPACESAALQASQTAPRARTGDSGAVVTPTPGVHFVYVGTGHLHHHHHHHRSGSAPLSLPPRTPAAPQVHGASAASGAAHGAVTAGHSAVAAGSAPSAHGAAAAGGAGRAAGSTASAPLSSGSPSPKVDPGKGPPELWAIAAVVAIVALPIIALGLIADDPMPHADVAAAVDLANAYNDLARTPGSACAPALPPLEPAAAAEALSPAEGVAPEEALAPAQPVAPAAPAPSAQPSVAGEVTP